MTAIWGTAWDALAIGQWYPQYAWAVDGLIYLILFTGAAQFSLGRQFPGRGGRAMVIAVGTALAVSAATIAHQAGFTLVALGPLAWLVLLTILGFMLFNLARSIGVTVVPAASISVLVMVMTAAGLGRALEGWLHDAGLVAPLQLAALIAMVALAWWIASSIGGTGQPTRLLRTNPFSDDAIARAKIMAQAETAGQAMEQVERSLVQLLERLVQLVCLHGIDHRSQHVLKQIERRERLVAKFYKHILRVLAVKRWKARDDRQHLPSELKELLSAAKDNVSEFDRNLELARVAHDSENVRLLLDAMERLLALERHAVSLAKQLRKILAEMSNKAATHLLKRNT